MNKFLHGLGLIVLFVALVPPVAGALFIPVAFLLEAPVALDPVGNLSWVAPLIGHALVLVVAYIIGFLPALALGFAYIAADAVLPPKWPRWLIAATLGGGLAYWAGGILSIWTDNEIDANIQHVLVGSCAVASALTAIVARTFGIKVAHPHRQELTKP